ncbi:MAG: hypothetical protein WC752_00425 [Patescibacteria group bacterium]|jgi:sporulation protein YlmC with PRC-barrel domain
MKLSHKQLISLPVYTQSDQHLGKVAGFEFNTDSHIIIKYVISQSSLVKEWLNLGSELEIASAQVISITAEKMIVEDAVTKEWAARQKAKIKNPVAMPASFSRISEEE